MRNEKFVYTAMLLLGVAILLVALYYGIEAGYVGSGIIIALCLLTVISSRMRKK